MPVGGDGGSGAARPSLGRLLVEAGVASEQQVKFAIAEGLGTGEKLGQVLVRKGWASYEVLAELLAEQWQLPFAAGAALSVDPAASKLIPLAEARELGVLPIGFEGDRVVVAITEPTQDLLTALAQRFGAPSLVVVTRADLDSILARLSLDDETAHEPVEAAATGIEAASANAAPAATDAQSAEHGDADTSPDQPTNARPDAAAERTLSSLEAAIAELQQIHSDVAALDNSLQHTRDQLAQADTELLAARATHEHDTATIQRLQAERSQQTELFHTLKAQLTTLNDTLTTQPGT